jgi:hypothetical protein
MKLKVDVGLARRLDEEAESLVGSLAAEPEKLSGTTGTFRPNYFLTAVNLTDKEVPAAPVSSVVDIDGNEIARFFPDITPSTGLFDRSHARFIRLCEELQGSEAFSRTISMTLVAETVFDWMRRRYQNTAKDTMTDFVSARCEPEVTDLEVWIPVAGTEVELEIDLGKVTLKPVSQETLNRWAAEWSSRRANITPLKRFLSDVGTKQIAVAAMTLTAEPIRAVEIAQEETETALSILRYFSFANLHPPMSTYCAVSGTEHVERPKYMVLQDRLLTSAGRVEANLRYRHPWRIDGDLLGKMKAKGLDILVRLISLEEANRTEFQNTLLKALKTYSKSSLAQDLSDKLLYVVTALEFALLKDDKESLQKHVGERMAFLVGESLEARIDIIKSYKRAYKLRSAAVHHGAVLTDAEKVAAFMRDAWETFNRLINESDRFATKEELIDFIDDIKFS